MIIATFNIQNLFHRDKSLIKTSMGKNVLDWISELDVLMTKSNKNVNDYDRLQELSFLLGFDKTNQQSYGVLRKRSGGLYLKTCHFSHETRASVLTNWNGWIPIHTTPVNLDAISNKARAIADIDPDILVLQEVEDRASLEQFNQTVLPELDMEPYDQVMVLEGNNTHGLGMGILTKNGYGIDVLKSHGMVLGDYGAHIFDIDCLEYGIITPNGDTVWVISCQFSESNETQRKQQAQWVANIYQAKRNNEEHFIMVCGTWHDTSYSDALSPLLHETDLKDVSKHQNFNVDIDEGKDGTYFRMGAYRMGVNIKQKDYLLLSPELFRALTKSGLNRKAMWPEGRAKWTVYSSVKNSNQAASQHPVLWGDMDI